MQQIQLRHSNYREQLETSFETNPGDDPNADPVQDEDDQEVLSYLQFNFDEDPKLIAQKMVEGVNIPGMGKPIYVDSSGLPEGWEKRVIQRSLGTWDVYITKTETVSIATNFICKV